MSLGNLSNRLSEVGGRAGEALAAAQEAVDLYRRLALDNPARYEPNLAASLGNLSIRLSEVGGRAGEALAAAQESVDLYRRLALDDPARYEPDLAAQPGQPEQPAVGSGWSGG